MEIMEAWASEQIGCDDMKQGDDLLVSGINTIIGMELEPSQTEAALETSERE